jgi:N-acetylmuramoyl-L-alanine amidase
MRLRAVLIAILALLTLLPNVFRAEASVEASGTRLSIAGGTPRFYMTYGHILDAELYAPIAPVLKRLGVSFERQGEDYIVTVNGVRHKESWPIVTSRETVPDAGHPCVLELGGNVYVPVRRVSELADVEVGYSPESNLVALSRPTLPVPVRVTESPIVSLNGIEVRQVGNTMIARIATSSPIQPRISRLAAPDRLILDFPGARWADGLELPAPGGDLKALRVGYPQPDQARLVLEARSPQHSLTAVRVEMGEVVATIGPGRQARTASLSPEASRQMALVQRVAQGGPTAPIGSRSGNGPGSMDPPLRRIAPDPAAEQVTPGKFVPAGTLQGRIVAVDAGHGGKDPGALGLFNYEKDLALKMCFQLQGALEARGARVVLTRGSDAFVSLEQRSQAANKSGADIFLSLHLNSMPRRNMQSGSETYWYSSTDSRRLARAVHPRLVGTVKGRDGGIRKRSLHVIRETKMPSVLMEVGYINHTKDEILMADAGFQRRLGDSITRGVLDFFGKEMD